MSTDVAELFARDPLLHTEEDITAIISEFRKARKSFNLTGTGGAKPKSKNKKKADELGIDLSDILNI